jgi:signal transduction histidine kinase
MKILLIDDDSLLRSSIARAMERHGWEVKEAGDGRSGLEMAGKHQPDVIVCDFDMEGMNGFETLQALRSAEATATIPFILMTGATQRAGLRQSMDLGADDYLAKPFNESQFLSCVEARVGRAQLSRRRAERRLAELRGSILSALPHELKTPLNGIIGYSALLSQDYDSFSREEIREMIATIHDSGKSLDRMVNRFLDYAQLVVDAARPDRSVTGGLRTPGPSLDLDAVARAAANRYLRRADLLLRLDAVPPAGFAPQAARILEELVDNACKFSAPPSLVEVRTRIEDQAFVLEVDDAGRGMTAEQIAGAGALLQFERKRHEQQGAGLGLAIVRLLVESRGGVLELSGEVGQGCSAIVRLPLGVREPAEPAVACA